MEERRLSERFWEVLEVRVNWPGRTSMVGNTVDVSDGGALIRVSFDPQPEPGEILALQLTSPVRGGEEAPVIRARVVRSDAETVAFSFIFDP